MEITIKGTQDQLRSFIKGLFSGDNGDEIMARLVEAGMIKTETRPDDESIYEVFEEVSWETLHLAHLIFLDGVEDSKGRYLTFTELDTIKINKKEKMTERGMSSRVGGAKKVSKRLGLKEPVLDIKKVPGGEKRYYLSAIALSTFEQFLTDWEDEYRKWLDEKNYFYPKARE